MEKSCGNNNSKYHIKYIGIINNSMGILTRKASFSKKINLPVKTSTFSNKSYIYTNNISEGNQKLPSFYQNNDSQNYSEFSIGFPNPERYNSPKITNAIYSARLPIFKGNNNNSNNKRIIDYQSLARVKCKEKQKGLQGFKISKRYEIVIDKMRKNIRQNFQNVKSKNENFKKEKMLKNWEIMQKSVIMKSQIKIHKKQYSICEQKITPKKNLKRVILKLQKPLVLGEYQ